MRVTGTATLHAPADRVWAALNDPAVLVRTIPGCEVLEAAGRDRYRMTITAGVASIKGTYTGDVELADPQPPQSFTLRAAGSGAPGTVNTEVKVTLEPGGDGTTLLTYDADAVVGGPVGGVGQRVLSGVAKRTAGEFFAAVDAVLNEPAAASVASATPAASVGSASSEPSRLPEPARQEAPGPLRFTRPPAGRPAREDPAAFVLGAAVALVGVLVGWLIGRRGG